MSEPVCVVCGRKLQPHEVRLNNRGLRSRTSPKRLLCVRCRKDEYDEYQKSIRELINKR